MATGSELRQHRRYRLPLVMKVRTDGVNVRPVTPRDVSATGIYFTISEDLRSGSDVEFTLIFPAGLVGGRAPQVRCWGRIVRVDRDAQGRVGVAATIQAYDWVRQGNFSSK